MARFTQCLALELAKMNITVNSVSSGFMRTRMVEQAPPEVLATRILPTIPIGRLGEPDEVAALVAWLASDDAKFVTGANLAVNGGQRMD